MVDLLAPYAKGGKIGECCFCYVLVFCFYQLSVIMIDVIDYFALGVKIRCMLASLQSIPK